ncbi:MAG: hypothetical protein ACTHJM_14705 [Marmoricola sp.]
MRFLKGFGQFWYDFLIGDDWKIAVAIVSVLAVGAAIVGGGSYNQGVLTVCLGIGVAAAFTLSLFIDVRRNGK